ncbi:ATP-binding protein [Flavobacterium chuncheonense]|uniref:histidine kinase n=1 Tax=Flavobacterium chuncheonense TaxID=2026653 RepID=A0ABW5YLL4_9FLAO
MKYYFILLIVLLLFSCTKRVEDNSIEGYFISKEYTSLEAVQKKQSLDSIFEFVKTQKRDSIANHNLLALSTAYYYISDFAFSRKAARESYELSLDLKDSVNMAKANYYIAETFDIDSKDSIYYYFSIAKKIYSKLKMDTEVAKTEFKKAYLLFYEGNYIDCETKMVEAIRLSEQSTDYIFRFSYFTLMGNCQEKLGNYDLALQYHLKAKDVLPKISDMETQRSYKVTSIVNIANLYEIWGDYDTVIKNLTSVIDNKAIEPISDRLYALILSNIAYAKMKKGDFNGIESDFLESLRITEAINNNTELLYRNVSLGEYYLTVGNFEKSEFYLKSALRLSKTIGNYNEYLKSLKFLSKVDFQNKDFYNDEYVRVKDSLTNVQLTNREKYSRIEYETSKLEEENKKLTDQNFILLIAFVSGVLLLTILFLIYSLKSQRKKVQLLLQKQHAEAEVFKLLEEHQKSVMDAKFTEQNRISKELHDGIMNKLYGVRLNLSFFNASTTDEALAKRKDYIDELSVIENEVRTISHDLNTDFTAEKYELDALIIALVDNQNKLGTTIFKATIDTSIQWELLDTVVKFNIYRIIQEAMHNVTKYASASYCTIDLHFIDGVLQLQIKDDGVGCDLKTIKRGIGLKNIKDRVRELKGKLDITTAPGDGFVLDIVFGVAG